MNLLKARTGWDWILGGLTLFRKRPFFLTNLFFIYLISMILLSMIPFIGQILPILIAPVFTFLFMYVCFSIDIGRQITFRECFEVLDRTIIWRLVMVGGFYLIFGLLAVGLSFLVDGGNLFFLFVQNSPDKLPSPDLGGMFIALGLIFIVYIPFAMATWFAAPLIGWKKMGFGKALFYSFFTIAESGFRSVEYFDRTICRCFYRFHTVCHHIRMDVLFLLSHLSGYFRPSGFKPVILPLFRR